VVEVAEVLALQLLVHQEQTDKVILEDMDNMVQAMAAGPAAAVAELAQEDQTAAQILADKAE